MNKRLHSRILLAIIAVVICSAAFAQSENDKWIQHAEQKLQTQEYDTVRINILNKLAHRCFAAYPAKTKLYSKQAFDLADSLHYIKGLADAYITSSLIYKLKGEYSSELSLDLEALKIYESLHDSLSIARTFNAIGVNRYQMEDYAGATEMHQKALTIFTSLHNSSGIAETSLKQGNVYMEVSNYKDAVTSYELALQKQKELKNEVGISAALNNLGLVYTDKNDFDTALEYLNESQRLIRKTGNLQRLPASYHNKARVYLKKGDPATALELARTDLTLSKKLAIRPALMEANKLLSDIYRAMKRFDLAIGYYDQYLIAKDSINSNEKALQYARLQSVYKIEEKEKEIDLLKKDKALAALTERTMWLVILGVLALACLVYYYQHGKIKRNHEIIKANQELHNTQSALAIAEIENKKLIERELRTDLEFRHRELLIYTLNLVQKNALMEEMRNGIQDVLATTDKDSKVRLTRLIKLIDYSLETEKDWDEFKMYFEKVHSSFFENLKSIYPDLTQSDLKLCALISLNLSMKEMAELLGISPESVKMARHRLRKKLNLETESNLVDFLNNFKSIENQNLTNV